MGTWPKVRPIHIRAISMDVTGTLVSFRGTLEEHYLGSALKCGVRLPPSANINKAFSISYKETTQKYPCFGHTSISGKEWWRMCVLRSLELAGVTGMGERQENEVFQRIYSVFGSQAAYERFEDALPFLHWANRRGIACGLLSNADDRYRDAILPMLGLTQDELQFQLFSKDYGIEKPDPHFFNETVARAQESLHTSALLPSQVLHIGNDYTKDFEGARRAGLHSVLLDRYNETEQAEEWRRRGAIVLKDLMDVVEFLGESRCRFGEK